MPLLANARRLALALILSAVPLLPQPANAFTNADVVVETDTLVPLIEDPAVRIVDVRSTEKYLEGHIPNAVNLPAGAVNDPASHVPGSRLPDAELASLFSNLGIDNATKVVFYDDQGGFHAARLFWILELYGHRDVAVLNGGFPKWVAENHPVSTEVVSVEPRTFALTYSPRREASADWLLDHQDDPSVILIDVRPTQFRDKGYIPWAKSAPWKLNLTDAGTLKSQDELVAHFAEFGVTPATQVAFHCQNGKASSHSYWAMRAIGHPRLRVYDRSWAEWGAADDLPKTLN